MIFPYQLVRWIPESQLTRKNAKAIETIRPWLDIEIFNPLNGKHTDFLCSCLLDTGSDLTFLTDEIGEYLGYKVEKGIMGSIEGVGGGTIQTLFYEKVGLRIRDPFKRENDIEIIDKVGFVKNGFPYSNPQQTGILGSEGFFRWVSVYFNYPKQIEITENRNLN